MRTLKGGWNRQQLLRDRFVFLGARELGGSSLVRERPRIPSAEWSTYLEEIEMVAHPGQGLPGTHLGSAASSFCLEVSAFVCPQLFSSCCCTSIPSGPGGLSLVVSLGNSELR